MAKQTPSELRAQGQTERLVAVGLIAIFFVMVGLLISMRGDDHWDRLVYLLGGVEALVFAGAGALFGNSVHRSQLAGALQDADDARDAAQQQTEKATNGLALSAAIHAKSEVRKRARGTSANGAAASTRREARPRETGAELITVEVIDPADADLYELAALSEQLLPVTPPRSE